MDDSLSWGLWVLFALYWLPSIVAAIRKSDNITGVVVLNLLLGWTVIGWIVSFVWAFNNSKEKIVIIKEKDGNKDEK